jgi:thiol:disulfide interchange protein
MKKLLVVIIFLFNCNYGFSQSGRPANELFEEAIAKAKKENKNIFIIFTATWCTPCKYLKRCIYDDYNVQYFEKNYVILQFYSSYVDVKKGIANEGAKKLLAQYKGDTTAIPYWLIINPQKKKLHRQLDFSSDSDFLKGFISVLKKTSKLNKSELQMIYDRFRQIGTMIPED